MADVGIFISFDFDRDEELHRNFYVQANRGDSSHDIKDCSLNEPYRPQSPNEWTRKAEAQIKKSDVVIVIVRDDTHSSPGVRIEVDIANRLDKPIFQIRPKKVSAGPVRGVEKIILWKWKRIDAEIDEILSKKRNRRRR